VGGCESISGDASDATEGLSEGRAGRGQHEADCPAGPLAGARQTAMLSCWRLLEIPGPSHRIAPPAVRWRANFPLPLLIMKEAEGAGTDWYDNTAVGQREMTCCDTQP